MKETEATNWRQIEDLNQRGGRCLSLVDLIRARTIPLEMAAVGAFAVSRGVSLLTAAEHGGTGKTTLLSALLMFMPPSEPIVTTSSPRVVSEVRDLPANQPVWVLAHEIGSGSWFGYIWGRTVTAWFDLLKGRRRLASCLHADTYPQLREILLSAPLNVAEAQLARVGLILFMRAFDGAVRPRRRTTSVWLGDGTEHRRIAGYDAASDGFELEGDAPAWAAALAGAAGLSVAEAASGLDAVRSFLENLVAVGPDDILEIRRLFIERFFA